MIIEHRGAKPVVDGSATIAPGAVISGDVAIGPHTVVLAGAIITGERLFKVAQVAQRKTSYR